MTKMRLILIPVFLLVVFASCEDVVKVTVPPGPDRLIVDAFVNNLPQKQKIRLTRSIPYFNQPGTEPPVEGATVAIADTTGGGLKLFNFADSGKGNYIFTPNKTTGDTFSIGHNYVLLIVTGNDTFISASKMNPTAHVDSLRVFEEDGKTLGFSKGKYIELIANDLIGTGNTYWIKTFRNDSFKNKITDLNLAYDMTQTLNSSQDGGQFIWPIRIGAINDLGRPFKPGDSAKVEVHSISYEAYLWLNLVYSESLNGGLFATPPVNIFTNIVNLNPAKKQPLGGFFCMSAVNLARAKFP